MDSEMNKKIQELQILEQRLQNFLAQKQSVQIELNEIENAMGELKNYEDEVYKILSGVMIKAEKKKILGDLKEKKKICEMKIDSVEKQQEFMEKRGEELKNEIEKEISEKK